MFTPQTSISSHYENIFVYTHFDETIVHPTGKHPIFSPHVEIFPRIIIVNIVSNVLVRIETQEKSSCCQ